MAGIIPACVYVQQACKRHLEDLDRAETGKWPYHFDADAGEFVAVFSCAFPHIKGPLAGQLLRLEGWQAFILTCIFGWKVTLTNKRRFRRVYIEMPRGNGKTTISATPALYMLAADDEGGAEVYSAARVKDQAKIAFGIAQHMARKCPAFRSSLGVDVIAHRIIHQASASFFEAVSSDADSLDGKNVHFGLIDELHAHRTRDVYDAIETGCGKRDQALLWAITTAGSDKTGIAYEQRAYTLNVLSGLVEADTHFGVVYTIDSSAHTLVLNNTRGLEEIGKRCSCKCAQTTLIEKSWLRAYAQHATTEIDEKTIPSNAGHTRTGQLGRVECAEVATSNGVSITTRNLKKKQTSEVQSGQVVTKKRSQQPISDGEINPEIDGLSSINTVLHNTESHENNTTHSLSNKTVSAPSATQLAKTYAWITATAQEEFGGFSADNVMLQSVFSETAKLVLGGHSNTCECHSYTKINERGILIEMPADDWTDPAVHRKANPNYEVSVEASNLIDMCSKAQHSPASRAAFLTKHLNVWVSSNEALYPVDKWDECGDTSLDIETYVGRTCRIAGDLASKIDIAAVNLLFDEEDGSVTTFSRFYVPRSALDETKNASYAAWEIDGHIIVTDGDVIDFNTIESDIREDLKRFDVIEIAFDPWQSTQMSTSLLGEGANVVEFRQVVSNFSEPTKELESLMRTGKIRHEGNPVMSWMISNVVGHYDAKDNVYPRKERPENKIDGAIALIMTLGVKLKAELQQGSYLSSNDLLIL